MGVYHLDKIFRPRWVAVIGASDRAGSVGDSVMRNLIATFPGAVDPVNPLRAVVHGRTAYASVADLPQPADLAVVCTPAATVPQIVRQCGAAGVGGMIILSAGFGERGEPGRQLDDQLRAAASEFPEMRIIGPNCLGVIVPRLRLNASFAAQMPRAGHLAFVSQSGALCTSVLDWAEQEQIGFSHVVSIGNMLDVTFADLIDYFGQDPHTQSMVLYAESIPHARAFMSAARAFTLSKPLVACKAGRFPESAQAAATHTGALAGEDAIFDAAFRRAGIERVLQIDEVFDCAELLARQRPPSGANLAILTNAGGPGVMATDALLARKGSLARFSEQTVAKLDAVLPVYWSHGNPLDVLGDATPERYAEALRIVLADPAVDAALVILTPQAMTDPTAAAVAVREIAGRSSKLVMAAWMGGRTVQPGIELLDAAGIPTYDTPEHAVASFMHLVSYGRNREVLYETPRETAVQFLPDRQPPEALLRSFAIKGRGVLTEYQGKQLLTAYGIPTTPTEIADSADRAVAVAQQIGGPVVLKILSEQISHKTDVGGVRLGLQGDAEIRAAYDAIMQAARTGRPDAVIQGVTVQPMVTVKQGQELILGAKHDPTFGAVILVGSGSTAVEVFGDAVLELPPLNERLALRMLQRLRAWPLLDGYRGRPRLDIDALVEVMIRFSYLVADLPEMIELDINPLLVTPERVLALDARAVVDTTGQSRAGRPFSHLAIRPYPAQFVRQSRLSDGTEVVLRPIRPEDEPLWHALLAESGPESIRARFGGLFRTTTHAMAARYCFIDYDRELAIVAEVKQGAQRQLVGVVRLVADPDHHTAEYAVFVPDRWQGRGLGNLLTEYCLELADQWGLQQLTAITQRDNHRMLALFRTHGFTVRDDPADGVAYAIRQLG